MPTPIIFLPGIMGSRLYFQNSEKYWDPDDDARMLAWLPVWPFRSDDDNRQDLNFLEPANVIVDTSSGITADQSTRGWSGVASTYYGAMLNLLQTTYQTTGDTYAIGYDWRQDIEQLAVSVETQIDAYLATAKAQQAAVVTHSMGGLVIRTALRNGTLAAKLACVIHVCIPATGAVVLYRRMFTGMVSQFDGSSIGDSAFRMLLGNNRLGFVGNVSGLPGAIELMPRSFFPKDAQGNVWNPDLQGTPFPDLYDNSDSPPGISPLDIGLSDDVLGDLGDRLVDVQNYDAFLGDPAAVLHPETYLIYGTGQQTDTHVAIQNNVLTPEQDTVGDGTVPEISATSLALDPSRVSSTPCEHSMACTNQTVQTNVVGILKNYVK